MRKTRLVPVAIAAGAVLVWLVSPWFGSIAEKTASGWDAFWANDWVTYFPFFKYAFIVIASLFMLAIVPRFIVYFSAEEVAKRKKWKITKAQCAEIRRRKRERDRTRFPGPIGHLVL